MHKNLSDNTKLLVVSDTGMYGNENDVFAFGPVVKELEEMLKIFDSITWIGFNREDQIKNTSYVKVPKNIETILLDKVGGVTLMDKFSIIKNYPKMYNIIHSEIKNHNYIHSRAPSNPAYIAMLVSKKYPQKKFWFKYAGDWIGEASKFYNFQREKLKKINNNCKVTVNGQWKNQPNNIIAFENPCLDEGDRIAGHNLVNNKKFSEKVDFCFVGGLNENKGIELIINTFTELESNKIGAIHVVGDGKLRAQVEEKAKQIKFQIIFYGYISKEEIIKIYKKSHFIILPSKSEGFPKVIGEAMNFGCIPIVSNISCISQYINNKNGFLLNDINQESLLILIKKSLLIKNNQFEEIIDSNYKLADKFTYQYYLKRIQEEIFQ